MKRPKGAELRSSPKANRNPGITKTIDFIKPKRRNYQIPIGLWLHQRFVRRSGECVIPFAVGELHYRLSSIGIIIVLWLFQRFVRRSGESVIPFAGANSITAFHRLVIIDY